MSKVYETGHAKNVANFETLISFVSSYGAVYNPSRASIKLVALQTKAAAASTAMNQVNTLIATNKNAIAAREIAFEPLAKLSTRLLNALKATDASAAVIENMATLNRKMQGKRASVKKTVPDADPNVNPDVPNSNQISASQQSFDSLLDTFDKEVKQLASIPAYAPNEVALKVVTLQALYTTLKTANAAVVNSATQLSNTRLSRNETMYNAETGIVAIAADVKSYVKSIFGASNANYKQISALSFRAGKN